jgi:hypothetical protein
MTKQDNISALYLRTKQNNSLCVSFNATTNLLVVDLVHLKGGSGHEVIRQTLDESKLLAHCEPNVDALSLPVTVVSAKRDVRTPEEWSDFFGVVVVDADGWDDGLTWKMPITRDMFKSRCQRSTLRIGDPVKFKKWVKWLRE